MGSLAVRCLPFGNNKLKIIIVDVNELKILIVNEYKSTLATHQDEAVTVQGILNNCYGIKYIVGYRFFEKLGVTISVYRKKGTVT